MEHNHEHDHGPADAGPIYPGDGVAGGHADTAARSLSDALRWSFRILSAIMVLVLVGFLLTGFRQVKSQEKGVKILFGRIDGVVEPGLAYTWPFPIGEIQTVNVQPRTLRIDDFWMNESPEDKTKTNLSERQVTGDSLRPGWDGALFTGDRNLIHVRLDCTYAISDVKAFKQAIPDKYVVRKMGSDIEQLDEPIRSAVCTAAIHAAAQRTAESIYNTQGMFLDEVRIGAQAELDRLDCGITIASISIPTPGITWPLAARGAYEQAQSAMSKKNETISAAMADAESTLNGAVGGKYSRLVRKPDDTRPPGAIPRGEQPYDLIGQYNAAREEGEAGAARSEQLLKQIDDILIANDTSGEVAGKIADARRYQIAIKQNVEARAKRFDEYLAKYKANPQLMVESLWAETRQSILTSPLLVKFYIKTQPNGAPTVVKMNMPPEIVSEIQQTLQKKADEKEKDAAKKP